MRKITQQEALDMVKTLDRAVAVYGLLHAHAAGQTDLTEDQLANVVTGVAIEASDMLRRVRGRVSVRPDDGGRWARVAHARAVRRPRRRRRLHA